MAFLFLLGSSAIAGEADFSGDLAAGGQPRTAWKISCPDGGVSPTQQAASLQVTQSGDYVFADAGELLASDLLIAVYPAGGFVPAQPNTGRIALIDGGGLVALQAGNSYELVVQAQCHTSAGTWAVAVSGPGDIESPQALGVPSWAAGEIRSNGPTANFGRGATPFSNAGVLQVDVTGLHALADVSALAGLDILASVYDGLFDAANPAKNRVAQIDDGAGLWLESGRDYRLVVSGFHPGDSGQYRMVLFPPGAMAINPGLNGGWFEPATSGQGVLLDVLPESGLVFMAWFTFDSESPFDPSEAVVGDASQRWLTGIGVFEEGAASVELAISNTRSGRFDQAAPGQSQDNDYGSATLSFTSCTDATLEYSLSGGLNGVIPLRRVANDNAVACGEQLAAPAALTD